MVVHRIIGQNISKIHSSINTKFSSSQDLQDQIIDWINMSPADSQTKTAAIAGLSSGQPLNDFLNSPGGAVSETAIQTYLAQTQQLLLSSRYFEQGGTIPANSNTIPVLQKISAAVSVPAIGVGTAIALVEIANSNNPYSETFKQATLLSIGAAVGEVAIAAALGVVGGAALSTTLLAVAGAGLAAATAMYAFDKNWDSIVPELLQVDGQGMNIDDAVQELMTQLPDILDDILEPLTEGLAPYLEMVPDLLAPFSDPDTSPIPDILADFPALLGILAQIPTPLIIDMDGDGIELTNVNGGAVYWDSNNDGMKEASAWVGKDDALLVLDENNNGTIDNHSELFGSTSQDGFAELASLDSNNDGVINASDTRFNELKIWIDGDQDGVSQEDELFSLTEASIASINLNATPAYYQVQGNDVVLTSTVTMADSSTKIIADALLKPIT